MQGNLEDTEAPNPPVGDSAVGAAHEDDSDGEDDMNPAAYRAMALAGQRNSKPVVVRAPRNGIL